MSMRASPIKSVVFGSTGIVGETITILLSKNADTEEESKPFIVAVSRSGFIPSLAHLPGVTCKAGDAKDANQTIALCQGAQVIYCSIGLPYNAGQSGEMAMNVTMFCLTAHTEMPEAVSQGKKKMSAMSAISATWERDFPVIVESMLKAAAASGAVLVWIDNLYMFGPEAAKSGIPMKEKSEDFTAYGRKPALRARMDRMLLEAAESGRCKVAIVRASDFYGPGVRNSSLGESFFPNIIKGTSAYLLGNPDVRHTYTYVPDLARATVAVGEAGQDAWGRAWHCPNAPAQTTAEVLQLANSLAGNNKPASFVVLKGIMRAFLALFIPALREMPEMSFVWENDYLVDHADFAARFPGVVATPLQGGVEETIRWWRAQENA